MRQGWLALLKVQASTAGTRQANAVSITQQNESPLPAAGGASVVNYQQRATRIAGYTAVREPQRGCTGLRAPSGGYLGVGGARRDRTADLLHAMQALSQLSYGPTRSGGTLRTASGLVKRRGNRSDHPAAVCTRCARACLRRRPPGLESQTTRLKVAGNL